MYTCVCGKSCVGEEDRLLLVKLAAENTRNVHINI